MMFDRLIRSARRHTRDETGASLVEYTVVIILFLLVFFAILDFGRLGFNWVMTEKAMQRAARIATVRPPACAGVPEIHSRQGSSSDPFGTLCRAGAVCVDGGTQSCVLGAATDFGPGSNPCTTPVIVGALPNNPTAGQIAARNAALRLEVRQEIWCILQPILPSNANPNNIRMTYTYNSNLGFVGGPYVPMVEVGVVTAATASTIQGAEELRFTFITPIPALAAAAGGAASTEITDSGDADSLADIPFPNLSVSLPGEDLNRGTNG